MRKQKELGKEFPYCVMFNKDGLVYSADTTHLSGMFYEEELIRLRDSINKTLKYYSKEKITNDFINKEDETELQKELSEMRSTYKECKKNVKVDDLYLIFDKESDKLKIGRSKNPYKRLSQLQTANGNSLEILYIKKGLGFMEEDIHLMFSDIREKGEWFKNDSRIIEYFKNELK